MQSLRVVMLFLSLVWTSVSLAQPVMKVQLPFKDEIARCTQNSNDTPTHQEASTYYDLDFGMSVGTKITAATDGFVYHVSHAEFGDYIRLESGNYWTIYAHLSQFIAGNGVRVNAGDVIALSGGQPGTPGAGTSTAPHLHFDVHEGSGVGTSKPMGVYVFDANDSLWRYLSTESHEFTCDESSANKNGHSYKAILMECHYTEGKCDLRKHIASGIGWYPPISICQDATQWYRLSSDNEAISSYSNNSACPIACIPN